MSSRDSGIFTQRDQESGNNQADDVGQAQAPREHRDEARDEKQDADWDERQASHSRAHIRR